MPHPLACCVFVLFLDRALEPNLSLLAARGARFFAPPASTVPSQRVPLARILSPQRIVTRTSAHPSQTTHAANVFVQPTPIDSIIGRTKAEAAADRMYRQALRGSDRVRERGVSLSSGEGVDEEVDALVDGDTFGRARAQ